MRAAVTHAVGAIGIVEVAEPPSPQAGEVVVRPEAIGLCGSDFHFLAGEIDEDSVGPGACFPRIQGHEIGATIEALGPGCRPELQVGGRVALWPLTACGSCYPCSVDRPNVCDRFQLIGIHADGGLQERLSVAQSQVFPIDVPRPAIAALAEPMSIAVRAVNRAAIRDGERVVVLGAGPIGQSVTVAAADRGARVLLVDPVAGRLELGRALGAEHTLAWSDGDRVVAAARDWTDGHGPPVVIDATGAPDAIRAAVDMAASAGRVVIVGMGPAEVGLRVGSFTEKELDVLGVSVCNHDEFAAAVALVERHGERLERLITHEFPLERAHEALTFAMDNPQEVMKVVVTCA